MSTVQSPELTGQENKGGHAGQERAGASGQLLGWAASLAEQGGRARVWSALWTAPSARPLFPEPSPRTVSKGRPRTSNRGCRACSGVTTAGATGNFLTQVENAHKILPFP